MDCPYWLWNGSNFWFLQQIKYSANENATSRGLTLEWRCVKDPDFLCWHQPCVLLLSLKCFCWFVEENFPFQKEDDRSFSHPNKPSLSAAHLRKQVLALGHCGTSQLLPLQGRLLPCVQIYCRKWTDAAICVGVEAKDFGWDQNSVVPHSGNVPAEAVWSRIGAVSCVLG